METFKYTVLLRWKLKAFFYFKQKKGFRKVLSLILLNLKSHVIAYCCFGLDFQQQARRDWHTVCLVFWPPIHYTTRDCRSLWQKWFCLLRMIAKTMKCQTDSTRLGNTKTSIFFYLHFEGSWLSLISQWPLLAFSLLESHLHIFTRAMVRFN